MNDLAEKYIALGYKIVPLQKNSKKPRDKSWIETDYSSEDFAPGCNVGLNHRQSRTIAVDVDNHERAWKIFEYLGIKSTEWRYKYTAQKNRWKCIFRMPEKIDSLTIRKLAAGEDHILEIRANGQDVLPGSVHPSGSAYEEIVANPWPALEDLPVVPDKLLDLYLHWDEYLPRILRDVFGIEARSRGDGGELTGNWARTIERFNEAHSVEAILQAHGYQGSSGRYLAPGSSTGQPGVLVYLDDGIEVAWSNHGGHDPLADEKLHDAFDCYRILDHNGDWEEAIAAATEALGIAVAEFAAEDFADYAEAPKPEPEGDPVRPFTFWDDARSFTPPKELVEGVLTYPSAAMFVAGYNVGKSALALDMAVAIAKGDPWYGLQVEQGGVLYMAVEGENSIMARTLAYPDRGIPLWIMGADLVDLSTSESRSKTGRVLLNGCKGLDVKLVIVDTLAEAAPAIDENSLDFAQVAKWAKRIAARLEACVLVIHHRAKHSAGSRGHTSVPGAMDTILEITRDDETGVCTGVWTKQRDLGSRGSAIDYVVEGIDTGLRNNFDKPVFVPRVSFDVPAEAGEEMDPVELDERERYRVLWLANQEPPVTSVRALKTDLGAGQDHVAYLRDKLIRDGFLERPSERTWRVTEAGIAWLSAREDLLF